MKEPRYMTLKGGLWFACVAIIIIAIYLTPLLSYAEKSRFFWQIALLSLISCLLMFLWRVSVGETGHVTCLGFDTKIRCESGVYLMPALVPFLRGIDLIIGFAVEVPSQQHEGNTSNIKVLFDQRRPVHHIKTETNLIGSIFSQIANSFIFFLFDLTTADGKVKYYKIGGIGYGIAWVVARATH